MASRKALEPVRRLIESGGVLLLAGLGDGHTLQAFCRMRPELFLDRRPLIWVVEPELPILVASMMLHDWSGPDGPIADPRVQFVVGADWKEQFRSIVSSDRMLPLPAALVRQSPAAAEIEAVLRATAQELASQDEQFAARIRQRDQVRGPEHYSAAIRGHAGRKPRALLLTTRFSTVLQYSTRDMASALQSMGWDTHLLMEPSPYHLLTRPSIRQALHEADPDVIFQIDHLRHEHGDLMPANVPFVCWVQDHLPNLTSASAAAKVGPNDFVLAMSARRYVAEYGYPPAQTLEFRKLTTLKAWKPLRPQRLMYASNWSMTPNEELQRILARSDESARPVFERVASRMREIYAAGDSLFTAGQVRELVERCCGELNVRPAGAEGLARDSMLVFERLNNVHFRQKNLLLAIEAAQRRGWDLHIYGSGWEKRPEFAGYHRGFVAHGEELDRLMAASVNLILEPYASVSHQRLLDSIAAGGFCAVRRHPLNGLLERFINLDPQDRAAREGVISEFLRHDAHPGLIDHAQLVKDLQECGVLPGSGTILPALEECSFATVDEFEAVVDRAFSDEAWRERVVSQQREAIEQRFTYRAGLRRALDWIANSLELRASAAQAA
jgi:hypothetical protein